MEVALDIFAKVQYMIALLALLLLLVSWLRPKVARLRASLAAKAAAAQQSIAEASLTVGQPVSPSMPIKAD